MFKYLYMGRESRRRRVADGEGADAGERSFGEGVL